MPNALIPEFDPSHLWSEQVIILQTPEGVYGRIVIYYPTAMDGGPDMDGPRNPIFVGHLLLNGVTSEGRPVQVPLQFPIPTTDPMEAACMFAECGNKAAEEFHSQSFRKAIATPGIIQ